MVQASPAMASGENERRAIAVAGYAAPYRIAAPAANPIPRRCSDRGRVDVVMDREA